jgi:signal transduction histidine kinase
MTFSPTPAIVRVDPEMLRAALLNLLLNACQSGSPEVNVSVSVTEEVCHIAVSDRGGGIAPDAMEHIFDAFYTTKKSGTGLGLAIVKRLMDLQQGSVSVRRREGGGTVAELTVSAAHRPAAAAPAP